MPQCSWRRKNYESETRSPFQCAGAPLQLPVVAWTVAAGGDMDPDYRATYLALIIIIIVCALALSIDFIVER